MSEWRKHTGTEMPSELAPAQIVEVQRLIDGTFFYKAGDIPWHKGIVYRLALDSEGLPYCSADGLEPNSEYVATDEDGETMQFTSKPEYRFYHDDEFNYWELIQGEARFCNGPHTKSGEPSESLMRVWRES